MAKTKSTGKRAREREGPQLCPFTGGTCNASDTEGIIGCGWWVDGECAGLEEPAWDESPRDWYNRMLDEAKRETSAN